MKLIFTAAILFLIAIATQVKAQTVPQLIHLDGKTNVKLTVTQFNALWSSKKLVCIKKGKNFGANIAYLAAFKTPKPNCVNKGGQTWTDNAEVGNVVYKLPVGTLPMAAKCQFVKGPLCK